jgi:hypothetical protein
VDPDFVLLGSSSSESDVSGFVEELPDDVIDSKFRWESKPMQRYSDVNLFLLRFN